MRDRQGTGALLPEEVALLQECFDTLISERGFDKDSAEGDLIANTLLAAFQRGIGRRADLLAAVHSAEIMRGPERRSC